MRLECKKQSNVITPPVSRDLSRIAKLLDRSRPQVVVVVGTGVAINATGQPHASWLGLLKHGIRYLVQEQFQPHWGIELEASLDAAFSPFCLQTALQHAELVEQALSTPDERVFAKWLESAFGSFRTRNDERARAPLEALRDLHDAGVLLLTTNYDSLLSDITDAAPVTWEEHDEFHRVMTRQRPGVLHIHGHWRRPTSIVLGRTSYNRVVADEDFQQLFRTLWLDWSWLYVGCGDGLGDPNLGRLLEWGKRWSKSKMPDFFVAQEDKAKEIAGRTDRPPNLVSIGYRSHDELPVILRSITPLTRCWPFVRIDDEFPLFRVPGSSIPFPSRQEYLDGEVPTFAADAELQKRLETHGWACVMDVASVGKTTLALRSATTHEQRPLPVFYLDLKEEVLGDDDASPAAAVHRLARPGAFLILDNIHHQSELARQLWQQWNAKRRDSRGRMLLVATRIHEAVVTPEQDLVFFERHPVNPAILLQPTPQDLSRVAKYIYHRVAGTRFAPMPDPPLEALAHWHRDYRSSLSAFTFVVLDSLADLRDEKWILPPARASAWVREKWLDKLDASELENSICLAAFGTQELEMLVRNEALPHPNKIEKLLKLGVVAETRGGRLGQYRHFCLREPGWGALILAAIEPPMDPEQIRFNTAMRHPKMALDFSSRLYKERLVDEWERLWNYLATNKHELVARLFDLLLLDVGNLVRGAQASNQNDLASFLWQALESNPDRLTALVRETPLHFVAFFIDTARRHSIVTKTIWEALAKNLENLVIRAWETPLADLASFLEKAQGHPAITKTIWEALEADLNKLAARAWETPLANLASFLEKARAHPSATKAIWGTLERDLDKLAVRALETPLASLVSFLEETQGHPIVTRAIWETLEKEADRLAARTWETPLNHLASFLDKAHGRPAVTKTIWKALEKAPDKLAARAWGTPLNGLASFLEKAQGHPIVTTAIWEGLEKETDKLAARAWETPLVSLASFLEKTHGHPTVTKIIWEALEADLKKLVARAWETPMDGLSFFLEKAQGHPVVTMAIWGALEKEPDRLTVRAREMPLVGLASFLEKAQGHPVVTKAIWKGLEEGADQLTTRVWETPLAGLASFLEKTQGHPVLTKAIWEVLEKEPRKLAASVAQTPLPEVASFCEFARQHGRNSDLIWKALENQPTRLSQSGHVASLGDMVGFCHYAPISLVQIALRKIKPGHWDAIPLSEGLGGATWLVWHCNKVDRNDLASNLSTLLLRRASWYDFPPQGGGFAQACWLLANVPSAAVDLVEPFLKSVCTEKWLQNAYVSTNCGQLASGLRRLALHQSMERCRQFHHRGLGARLNREMARFQMALPNDQSQIIQLLGCAGLCGWAVSQRVLASINPALISQLPLLVLPHRPEADGVEDYQTQLWLGLRTFVSITKHRLSLPRSAIDETLKLWRVNLEQTASMPGTSTHDVNQSMVAWLETCIRVSSPALMPSSEPLWTLVGFPVRLGSPGARG